MAIAIGPQWLAPAPDGGSDPVPLVLSPAGNAVTSRAGDHWQGLRLFGRGRRPRTFESGAERDGDL